MNLKRTKDFLMLLVYWGGRIVATVACINISDDEPNTDHNELTLITHSPTNFILLKPNTL